MPFRTQVPHLLWLPLRQCVSQTSCFLSSARCLYSYICKYWFITTIFDRSSLPWFTVVAYFFEGFTFGFDFGFIGAISNTRPRNLLSAHSNYPGRGATWSHFWAFSCSSIWSIALFSLGCCSKKGWVSLHNA